MKRQLKASITLICVLLMACGEITQTTPAEDMTSLPISTSAPSKSAEYIIESTPTQFDPLSIPLPTFSIPDGTNVPFPTSDPRIPTLLPTIDPNLASELLRNSISIQQVENINNHNVQRITGWDYGFRQLNQCNSFQWLDSDHLLLYPRTGEGKKPAMDSSVRADLSSQHIVINLTNGNLWFRPWSSVSTYEWNCDSIYWAQELGIIINQQEYATTYGPLQEAVFIYTFDGQKVAEYWGEILGVSPSGEKILVDEDTIIDLRNNEVIDLAWHMNYDVGDSSVLYWSSDETRLYRCCYYFADLKTGKSYDLEWDELRGVDGKPISFTLRSPHIYGHWVRNDTYFFPTWNYMSDTGDPRIIFSPIEMKYYFIEFPSNSRINTETMIYAFSPNGNYVWITGFSYADGSYHNLLVDLTTLESIPFDLPGNDFFWSPDSKYAWMNIYDSGGIYVLSVDKRVLSPFPTNPTSNLVWHPTTPALAFLTEENRTLSILNVKDMSVKNWKLPSTFYILTWSPDGSHIALMATDGSLWQIDYPNMENLEQLTEPIPDVKDIAWSPAGNSIAFVSGTDIYIVDTIK